MSGKTAKWSSVLATLLFTVLAFIAQSQVWGRLEVEALTLEYTGATQTGILGIALAALAAVGALTIAGRVLRYVIAGLLAIMGVGWILLASAVIAEPELGFVSEIKYELYIVGDDAIRDFIDQGTLTTSPWPIAIVVAGVGLILTAVFMAARAHTWPDSGKKYARSGQGATQARPRIAEGDRISQWDAISSGDDPTDDDAENEKPR